MCQLGRFFQIQSHIAITIDVKLLKTFQPIFTTSVLVVMLLLALPQMTSSTVYHNSYMMT